MSPTPMEDQELAPRPKGPEGEEDAFELSDEPEVLIKQISEGVEAARAAVIQGPAEARLGAIERLGGDTNTAEGIVTDAQRQADDLYASVLSEPEALLAGVEKEAVQPEGAREPEAAVAAEAVVTPEATEKPAVSKVPPIEIAKAQTEAVPRVEIPTLERAEGIEEGPESIPVVVEQFSEIDAEAAMEREVTAFESVEEIREAQTALLEEMHRLSATVRELHNERRVLAQKLKDPKDFLEQWSEGILVPETDDRGNPILDKDGKPIMVRVQQNIFSEKNIAKARKLAKERLLDASVKVYGKSFEEWIQATKASPETTKTFLKKAPSFIVEKAKKLVSIALELPIAVPKFAVKATLRIVKIVLTAPFEAAKLTAVLASEPLSTVYQWARVRRGTKEGAALADIPNFLRTSVDSTQRLDRIEAIQKRLDALELRAKTIASTPKEVFAVEEFEATEEEAHTVIDRLTLQRLYQRHVDTLMKRAADAAERGNQGESEHLEEEMDRLSRDPRKTEAMFLTNVNTGEVRLTDSRVGATFSKEEVDRERRFAIVEMNYGTALRQGSKAYLERTARGDQALLRSLHADKFGATIDLQGRIVVSALVTEKKQVSFGEEGEEKTTISGGENLRRIIIDAKTSAKIFSAIDSGRVEENGRFSEATLKEIFSKKASTPAAAA